MNSFAKKVLIVIGSNILSFILFSIPIFFSGSGERALGGLILTIILIFVSLFVQLIVGLGLLGNPEKRGWGKALLLSVGFFFIDWLFFVYYLKQEKLKKSNVTSIRFTLLNFDVPVVSRLHCGRFHHS